MRGHLWKGLHERRSLSSIRTSIILVVRLIPAVVEKDSLLQKLSINGLQKESSTRLNKSFLNNKIRGWLKERITMLLTCYLRLRVRSLIKWGDIRSLQSCLACLNCITVEWVEWCQVIGDKKRLAIRLRPKVRSYMSLKRDRGKSFLLCALQKCTKWSSIYFLIWRKTSERLRTYLLCMERYVSSLVLVSKCHIEVFLAGKQLISSIRLRWWNFCQKLRDLKYPLG